MIESTNSVSWPQRFVYVCTATAGNIVNIAPMLSAGPGRVVGLLVLRAVNNLKKPTVNEKSNAIHPGERLMQYGAGNINLGPENMAYIDGKSDSFTDWVDVFATARKMAVRLNAEIVFNITGGPRPVMFGALLGAGTSGQNTPITTISFGHDAVPKKVYLDADGQLIEEVLPVDLHLSLDDYMKSVGLTEVNRHGRLAKERRMSRENSLAGAMSEKSLEGDRQFVKDRFGELMSKLAKLEYRNNPITVLLPPKTREFFADIFRDMNDTETTDHGILIRSEYDLEFLKGKWLESKVFDFVGDIIQEHSELEIACGFEFGSLPRGLASKQISVISDFDLVLFGQDRLEIIEAKAVVRPNQIHPAIAKLNSHIRTLGGDAGRAWIVAPLLDQGQLDKNDMIANAQKNGIRIFFGCNALADLEVEIRRSRRL